LEGQLKTQQKITESAASEIKNDLSSFFYLSPKDRSRFTVQCKVFPVHAMKAYTGRRGRALLILNLGTRFKEWLTSRPGRFTRNQKPQYWVDPRADLDVLEKKQSLVPTGTQTTNCPAHNRVAIPTMLSQLLQCPASIHTFSIQYGFLFSFKARKLFSFMSNAPSFL
jgi:hypothetical protein